MDGGGVRGAAVLEVGGGAGEIHPDDERLLGAAADHARRPLVTWFGHGGGAWHVAGLERATR